MGVNGIDGHVLPESQRIHGTGHRLQVSPASPLHISHKMHSRHGGMICGVFRDQESLPGDRPSPTAKYYCKLEDLTAMPGHNDIS